MKFGRYSKENKDAPLPSACDNLVVTIGCFEGDEEREKEKSLESNHDETARPINENCIRNFPYTGMGSI